MSAVLPNAQAIGAEAKAYADEYAANVVKHMNLHPAHARQCHEELSRALVLAWCAGAQWAIRACRDDFTRIVRK
jgi:hypothetical protein